MVISSSRWHGRWDRNKKSGDKKSGESFLPVQFGGTGYDGIFGIKLLSTKDIVAWGTTYSSTFLGQDASAYFNGGTYALWLGIFDGKTFAKKALVFENGRIGSTDAFWLNSNTRFGEKGYNAIAIDASDNIYAAYGPYSTATEMLVKKRSGTDLSLLATGTKYSIHYATGNLLYNDGYLYLITNKAGTSYSYFRKLNLDLTLASGVDLGSTYAFNNAAIISNNYIFGFLSYNTAVGYAYVAKYNLSGVLQTQRKMDDGDLYIFESDSYMPNNSIAAIGSKIYLVDWKKLYAGSDVIVTCLNQSDFTKASGWTDLTIDCSFGTPPPSASIFLQAIGNRLFYYGRGRSGSNAPNYWELLLFGEINPDTGALISSYTQPKYKDNATLISKDTLATGASWIPCGKPVLIGSNTLLCGVSTTGAIAGSVAGGGDVVFLPLDITTGNLYV